MRTLGTVAWFGLVGCGAAPPRPPPIARPTPAAAAADRFAALARADALALLDDGELVALAYTQGALVELGRLRVGDAHHDGDTPSASTLAWIDRDHALVQLGETYVASVAGLARVAPPPPEVFAAVPAPANDHDPALQRATDDGAPRAAGGAVWWNACTWGLPYDGFQCSKWSAVRIWPPDPARAVVDGEPESTAVDDPRWRDAPAGFPIAVTERGRVTCHRGPALRVLGKHGALDVEHPDDPEDVDGTLGASVEVGGQRWVARAGGPAALLVDFGGFGLASYYRDSFALYTGCDDAPAIVGTTYQLLGDGWWIAHERTGDADADADPPKTIARLRRGTARIADLPPFVAFVRRPAR